MPVKIVTDSVADIPEAVARDLDISVVPLILRFGEEEYRDGVDITVDEFYEKLKTSGSFPTTSVPPAADYTRIFEQIAEEGNEAFVITLSSTLSGTHKVAVSAAAAVKDTVEVRVFDSRCATMIEGFIAMRAAEAARDGASLDEVEAVAAQTARNVDMITTFRTLEYLRRGGRIGAAKAFLGTALKLHPFIKLKDGHVAPAGAARTREAAVKRLIRFAEAYKEIELIAVEHTECPEEARVLIDNLSAYCDRDRIYVSTMTPVIGAHTGPGLLLVGILGKH